MPFRFRDWFAVFLSVLIAVAPVKVSAGSVTLLGAGKPSGAASVPFAITFGAAATNLSGPTFTFAAQNIGTSDATRTVFVGVQTLGCTTTCVISSVTVNGVSATEATGAYVTIGSGGNVDASDIWLAPCGTSCGTSTTVVVTTGNTTGRVNIVTYGIIGTSNAFSVAGNSANLLSTSVSATLSVPSGGGTIGFGFQNSGTGSTFTNLTSDLNSTTCCGTRAVGAGSNTALSGSNTFTINFTGGNNIVAGSFATFSP